MDLQNFLYGKKEMNEIPVRRMDEIINKEARTAYDLRFAPEAEQNEAYGIEQTRRDASEIRDMIESLKLGEFELPKEETERRRLRLKAVQGRNMAHLMINDHVKSGDSPEMADVKTSLADLEQAIMFKHREPLTEDDMDNIDDLYQAAMQACQHYCEVKDPWTTAGMIRKSNVQNTLNRLIREYDAMALGRQAMREGTEGFEGVKSGMELLTFGTITDLAERFRYVRIDDEKKELKAKIELAGKLSDDQNPELQQMKARLAELEQQERNMRTEDEAAPEIALLKKKQRRMKDPNHVDDAGNEWQMMDEREAAIGSLPAELQGIANVLFDGGAASSLVRDIKKPKAVEKKLASEMVAVRNALSLFNEGQAHSQTVRIGNHFVRFVQDKYGLMEMHAAGVQVRLTYGGEQLASELSRDIVRHPELYGDDAVRRVMSDQKDDLKEMTCAELLNTREYAAEILHSRIGVEKSLLNNVDVESLRELALSVLDKSAKLTSLRKEIDSVIKHANETQKEGTINTVLNLELQKVGHKADGVVIEMQHNEEASGWTTEEEQVRNLAADMLFSNDTLAADELQYKPGERMKNVILQNADAMSLIIFESIKSKKGGGSGILDRMLESLPFFAISETKERTELKEGLKNALLRIRDEFKKIMFKTDDVDLDQKKARSRDLMAELALNRIKNKDQVKKELLKAIGKMSDDQFEKFADIEKSIDESVLGAMDGVQEYFSECVTEFFTDKKEGDKKAENKAEKKEEKKAENKAESAQANKSANKQAEAPDDIQKYEEKQRELARMQDVMKEYQKESARYAGEIRKLEDEIANAQKTHNALGDGAEKIALQDKIKEDKKKLTAMKQESMACNEVMEAQRQKMDVFVATELKNAEDAAKIAHKKAEKEARQERIRAIRERTRLRKEAVENNATYREKMKTYNEYSALLKKDRNSLTPEKQGEYDKANASIKKLKEEIRDIKYQSRKELDKILEQSAKGQKGQGLFVQNVMKTYFMSMPVTDQRSMLAGAMRNCRPVRLNKEAVKKELTKEERINMMADTLGGMFKGAGPLFQKMLQGLPTGGLPTGLQKAIADTQDNLASIPEAVIKNHVNAIIGRSNGKIEKIEVKRSLGAASVGQAFLCKAYGPGLENGGREIVIKLLRPDVRNRMMREKETMLNAARMTDRQDKQDYEIREMEKKKQIGGMEATYLGNLQRIEEELDLTIEYRNCEMGSVYDNDVYKEQKVNGKTKKVKQEKLSRSMKMSNLADPTSDTCIMEKAGSKTVKRYMADTRELMEKRLLKFCETREEQDEKGNKHVVIVKEADGSYKLRQELTPMEMREIDEIYRELDERLTDLQKRQQGLLQLTEKWVTEGVFEKGYYHGDLHAGNIMISENDPGITVIDFGNATKLNDEQQKHVTIMMIAAGASDVKLFRHSFHMLLKNTPEEVYQEKRDELTAVLEEVLTMGSSEDTGQRIAVALVKAQELGLELPPVIANFSSGQIRLQNAVKDMNTLYKDLRNNVAKLQGMKGQISYQQHSLDTLTAGMKEASGQNAQKRRSVFANKLKDYQVTQEKDFKEGLKDPDHVNEFLKNYDLVDMSKLNKELSRLNEILRTGKLTAEEKKTIEKNRLSALFPAIANYMSLLSKAANRDAAPVKGQKKRAYNPLMTRNVLVSASVDRVWEFLKNPERGLFAGIEEGSNPVKVSSLDEFIEKFRQNAPGMFGEEPGKLIEEKDGIVSETSMKLAEYNKAQKEGRAEDAERLADETWKAYYKERHESEQKRVEDHEKMIRSEMTKMLPKEDDLYGDSEKAIRKLNQNLEIIRLTAETYEKNKSNGAEIRAEKEKLSDLFKKSMLGPDACAMHEKELKESLNRLIDLMNAACTEMLSDLAHNAEDDPGTQYKSYGTAEPEDFLSVMGGVIARYKFKAGMRVGIFTSLSAEKKIGGEF